MAARTLSRVVCEIGRVPVRTYETVLTDTFASLATSFMVAIEHLPPDVVVGARRSPGWCPRIIIEALRRSASMKVGQRVLLCQWLALEIIGRPPNGHRPDRLYRIKRQLSPNS